MDKKIVAILIILVLIIVIAGIVVTVVMNTRKTENRPINMTITTPGVSNTTRTIPTEDQSPPILRSTTLNPTPINLNSGPVNIVSNEGNPDPVFIRPTTTPPINTLDIISVNIVADDEPQPTFIRPPSDPTPTINLL